MSKRTPFVQLLHRRGEVNKIAVFIYLRTYGWREKMTKIQGDFTAAHSYHSPMLKDREADGVATPQINKVSVARKRLRRAFENPREPHTRLRRPPYPRLVEAREAKRHEQPLEQMALPAGLHFDEGQPPTTRLASGGDIYPSHHGRSAEGRREGQRWEPLEHFLARSRDGAAIGSRTLRNVAMFGGNLFLIVPLPVSSRSQVDEYIARPSTSIGEDRAEQTARAHPRYSMDLQRGKPAMVVPARVRCETGR
ncbi:hypothetical protein LX36DRAFT_242141 [Colletotrichum falcatum]|nr:hypothetical protein LX36DRAFT_242141 [Colletotrichum falcatum]